ncbi:MAG: hypothetical protein KDD37_02515 [Bdellovibrionales bacterium]|nr:hypothetical protein [Bdellovibrionales bacterium]
MSGRISGSIFEVLEDFDFSLYLNKVKSDLIAAAQSDILAYLVFKLSFAYDVDKNPNVIRSKHIFTIAPLDIADCNMVLCL